MPSRSLRDLASQAAYLERMLEFCRSQLQAVERLGHETVELEFYGENAIDEANSRHGFSMREHLELAIRYGEEWYKAVNEVLTRAAARPR